MKASLYAGWFATTESKDEAMPELLTELDLPNLPLYVACMFDPAEASVLPLLRIPLGENFDSSDCIIDEESLCRGLSLAILTLDLIFWCEMYSMSDIVMPCRK